MNVDLYIEIQFFYIYSYTELFLHTDPYIYLPIYIPTYVTIQNQPHEM